MVIVVDCLLIFNIVYAKIREFLQKLLRLLYYMGGNSMKVVSKIPMLLVLLVGLFLFGLPNSQATDVWVAQIVMVN